MLIIGDFRLPKPVKVSLERWGDFVDFKTQSIVYESISGHVDVFFHKVNHSIIAAPNTPKFYLDLIESNGYNLILGQNLVGDSYPDTARYNATFNSEFLFCNAKITDSSILNFHQNKTIFQVNQGYTACNLLIGNNSILSSDMGISTKLDCDYFNPSEIILSGQKNGFIGGASAVFQNYLFLFGSLKYLKDFRQIELFAKCNNLEIKEMYDGPLVDGGGLLFL